MNWLLHPIVLEGKKVRLVPLEHDHFAALLQVSQKKEIWQYMTIAGYDNKILEHHLKSSILKRATGEQYPFTVIDKATGNIIGSTLFHNIFPEHRKIEIGWTWYDPIYWGTGLNTECKLLLLTHCFETLKTVRVQFQVNETNIRSRAAVQKIGGKMEGILRKERVRPDGGYRNTVMFSIIDDEWAEVKRNLEKLAS